MPRFNTSADALAFAEQRDIRVRIHYGNPSPAKRAASIARGLGTTEENAPAVGQDWGDVYSVSGRLGRSMGWGPMPVRALLMISNRSSTGGPAILTDCIVRVRYANRAQGGDLYRHPDYLPPSRWDAFPDDLARSVRDWAKHFAADPLDARGTMLDRLTLALQEGGERYTLRILPAPTGPATDIGTSIAIEHAERGTLAVIRPDGSAVRYWGDGTPEHLDAPGSPDHARVPAVGKGWAA